MNEPTELERLRRENTWLRAQLGEIRCSYGHKDPKTGVCQLGYPGCACADDWFAAQDEMGRELVDRVGMLREQIRVADVAYQSLHERHQEALGAIERANALIGATAEECKVILEKNGIKL